MKDDTTFDIALYWQVLRRRLPLLLIPVILLGGILGLGSFLIPNIYRTAAHVVVRQEQDPLKGLAVDTQITQQLGGVIQSLQQPSVQKEIFERLKAAAPKGLTLEESLADYQRHLVIRRREEGRDLLVEFIYEGTPAKYAVEVVNAFADRFQREGTRLVATSLVVSLDFVDQQLESFRARLLQIDQRERLVRQQLNALLGDMAPLSAMEGLSKSVAEQLAKGEGEIQRLTLQAEAAAAQLEVLRAQLRSTSPTLEVRPTQRGDQAEAELERLVAETQARLTAAQMRYTPRHPEVGTLQAQLDDLQARLAEVRGRSGSERGDVANPAYEALRREAAQAQAAVELARVQLNTLMQRNDRLRRLALQVPAYEERLTRLNEEQAALQGTYDSLLQRKQSLEVNQSFEEAGNTGRFDISRAGGVPLSPVRPNRTKYLVLGFLAGLFIGVSFVLLAEYLDHSVRSEHDLRRYLEAPVLAVLPRAPKP
ncbi:MAG: hypothetical protein HUU35_12840 [Armatimonadetes bacterium]|nr:hypothetical protein [Armatimonadota bacterium]